MKVNELPVGDWLYEMKFDGYRALAFKADKEVRLISRNRKSFNDDYPVHSGESAGKLRAWGGGMDSTYWFPLKYAGFRLQEMGARISGGR